MLRKTGKWLVAILARKLLASVDFLNFKERIESRLNAIKSRFNAIESRLNAIESRLDLTETRVDLRLDFLEDRSNNCENRLALIENPSNFNGKVLGIFYNSERFDLRINELVQRLREVLNPSHCVSNTLIRLGSSSDGGYVLIDDLNQSEILFSIGVGENITFDQDCEPKLAKVVMVDHTVPEFVPPPGKFEIIRAPLVAKSSKKEGVTIGKLLELFEVAEDYILKLDIEGDEWSVLKEIDLEEINKFRQIIVEFHNLNDFDKLSENLIIIEKIALTHTPIVVHPNNNSTCKLVGDFLIPDVIEVTWVRKNSYNIAKGSAPEVAGLLSPNSSDLPDVWFDWIFGKSIFKN
jgi:hypothetical protein